MANEPTLTELLESLNASAVLFDAAGVIRYANRAAAALVGKSPGDIVGSRGTDWQALQAQHLAPAEVVGAPPEGTEWLQSVGFPRRYYQRAYRPLAESGGRLEILRDVTETRREAIEREREVARHEREMQTLETRLETVEKYKMELTANVTHDLRTPLASIKAAVSGLLAGDVAYDPNAFRETLSLIEEETDRLQRRVSNLLHMAGQEAGGETLTRDWIDVQDVVSAALESLKSVKGARPVKLDLPEELPLVLADYDEILIALRNLIENAFIYSPPEKPVEISANVSLGQMHIRVRDYGSGLMPDEFERVFDKFYRGRSARRIPGTGLGLPICRGIAEAHGGRLWAEHAPGGGVAFVLSLPLEDCEIELEPEPVPFGEQEQTNEENTHPRRR